MRSNIAIAVVLLVITACTSHPDAPARQEPVTAGDAAAQLESSERGEIRIVELTRGLEHPWALAFLPDGRMLVTERPGRLLLLDARGGFISEISGLPTTILLADFNECIMRAGIDPGSFFRQSVEDIQSQMPFSGPLFHPT